MRVLGIDYGRRRFGLALSDEDGVIAHALPPHQRLRSLSEDLRSIGEVVKLHQVEQIAIGLPINMDGSEGEMAREVLAFAGHLATATKLPVTPVDERLTTSEAERVLIEANLSRRKRKGLRDSLAAVLILQCHLDQRRNGPAPSDMPDR